MPLAAILGGKRPLIGAAAFLGGIFVVYLLCGLILLIGLDALFDLLGSELTRRWSHPDTADLVLQIVISATMVVFAWWLATARQCPKERKSHGSMAPGNAFVLATGLTIAGLPGAFPYFGAVDQILRADPGPIAGAVALVFYNVVFLLSLFALVAVRLVAPSRSQPIFTRITDLAERWGRRVILVALELVGGVLLVDGIGWFIGYSLLPAGLK